MSILKREIKITQDGSKTLNIPCWGESYHSKHGALQEAIHVFLKNGLDLIPTQKSYTVLEFGFGTGLNALLTHDWATRNSASIRYHSLEKFPITHSEWENLDYAKLLPPQAENQEIFKKMHSSAWNFEEKISDFLSLKKIKIDFKLFEPEENLYDIVFFDAFGKRVQPELWTFPIFEKIYKALKKFGLLTTYAANGATQRILNELNFNVEKKLGPPGKREMLIAWKN